MKIYHYANIDDWKRMKIEHKMKGEPIQLKARRRLGRDHAKAWEIAGVFGLLQPVPENWKNNNEFNLTWDALRHDLGERLLLEIEIDPETDQNTFVVDRAHMEGFLYQDVETASISGKYNHKKRVEAEEAYAESKISIREYLERADELGYSLPEVIITKDIPVERLTISEEQPFLEEVLREGDCKYKREFIERMREVPELNAWHNKKTKSDSCETSEASRLFKGGLR